MLFVIAAGSLILLVSSACGNVATLRDVLATSPGSASPLAERPVYKIGDTWVRPDGTYTLTAIDGDTYLFTSSRGSKVWLTRDLFVTRVEKSWGYMELYPPPKIHWPLEVGKWGVWDPIWRHSWGTVSQTVEWYWRVVAYEDEHTLLHGKVKVFKIVHTMSDLPWRSFTRTLTVWYAPEVQRIIRIEGHSWFGPFLF